MLEALLEALKAVGRTLAPAIRQVATALAALGRLAWRVVKPPLLALLQLVAALIVLFEEWGWRPLSAALAYLARFRPWARMELWIAGLPPYGALAVFALPSAILLPLKFVALWLLANAYYTTASLLFVAAKVASTAFVARIFTLTKPALMQIGWFARAYHWFMPWKEAIFAEIRQSWIWRQGRVIKWRIKQAMRQAWSRWQPWLATEWSEWRAWVREALPRWLSAGRAAWTALRLRTAEVVGRARVESRRLWRRIIDR
ncbi:MAG: hypothetical protein ACT4N2_14270 [Hyphomicrobium sp.]